MNKTHKTWAVSKLARLAPKISYPEYQREPFVWDRVAKQRLIDSMIRGFDIASIYFHVSEDEEDDEDITEFECVDGRQRINAILSFLGENKDEDLKEDLNFRIRISNEVDPDQSDEDLNPFKDKTYEELRAPELSSYKNRIDNYQINVVLIRDISEEKNELNLLFQRLQLGKPLNAGEKLHAMAGDMRNYIFSREDGIALLDFFLKLTIPARRYSREQVAAQIAYNYFSKYGNTANAEEPPGKRGVYSRSRYYDLQLFFKAKMEFSNTDKELAKEIRDNLAVIGAQFGSMISNIKNRAIAVSAFLYATWLHKQERKDDLEKFPEFLSKLIRRVDWQVTKLSKTRQGDAEYEDLFRLQSYINQAAVEEYAIAGREALLDKLFQYYLDKDSEIKGDRDYQTRTGEDPETSPIPET
jgi:hypothetical protein